MTRGSGLTEGERKWLNTVDVGEEMELYGQHGAGACGAGMLDLERMGYILVQQDVAGYKITRLK